MKEATGKFLIRLILLGWFLTIPLWTLLDVILDLVMELLHSVQLNYYRAKTNFKDGWETFKHPLKNPLLKRK